MNNIKKIIKGLVAGSKLHRLYLYNKSLREISKNLRKVGQCKSYERENLFDEERKIIFIHIPKAAGMSVVNTIYGQSKSNHASAMDYAKQDEQKFLQTYSFSIVRNPYTRLYSAFHYLANGGMNVIDKVWWNKYCKKYVNFESFILDGGLEKAIKDKAEHFIPQVEFICDESQNVIVNEVFKLEEIDKAEEKLTHVLGTNISFSRQNSMKVTEINIEEAFTSDMKKVVRKFYNLDFILLKY